MAGRCIFKQFIFLKFTNKNTNRNVRLKRKKLTLLFNAESHLNQKQVEEIEFFHCSDLVSGWGTPSESKPFPGHYRVTAGSLKVWWGSGTSRGQNTSDGYEVSEARKTKSFTNDRTLFQSVIVTHRTMVTADRRGTLCNLARSSNELLCALAFILNHYVI